MKKSEVVLVLAVIPLICIILLIVYFLLSALYNDSRRQAGEKQTQKIFNEHIEKK